MSGWGRETLPVLLRVGPMFSDLTGRLNAVCARRAPLVLALFALLCAGCVA